MHDLPSAQRFPSEETQAASHTKLFAQIMRRQYLPKPDCAVISITARYPQSW